MSTSEIEADSALRATFARGEILVRMKSGREIRFPVAANPRLAPGSPAQLRNIEISPLGLHWPDLDEDLSFRGLLRGDFGQWAGRPVGTNRRRSP